MKNYLLDRAQGDFVILTDGCADLSPEEMRRYGVWPKTAPFSITVDGKEVDFADVDEFYDHLCDDSYAPDKIRTASPNLADVRELLEDIVKQTPEHVTIYYCGTSPHISAGTANAMRIGLGDIAEDYPERKFAFIDTQCTSNGQGLMLQYLAAYEGDDLVGYAREIGTHIMHLFTQREMAFSAKSGRYGLFKSIGMQTLSAMKFSPFMFFPSDDKLAVESATLRADMVLRQWVEYFEELATPETALRIGYGSCAEKARAEKFVHLLSDRGLITPERVQWSRVGPAVGAHTGPTVLSIFFEQKVPRPVTKADFTWKPASKR